MYGPRDSRNTLTTWSKDGLVDAKELMGGLTNGRADSAKPAITSLVEQ